MQLQKHTMETESRLSQELMQLNSHIVELNSTVLDLQDQLVEQQQRHLAQNNRASAREAEAHIAFNKESVRAHLQRNGVKCFHWEDLTTLMKKLEQLHQQPDKPICYVADVLDKLRISESHGSHSLTQHHLQQLNTSVRSNEGTLSNSGGRSAVPTTPTANTTAAPSSGSRANSASRSRRTVQQDTTGQVYEVGYRFSNHSPPRVRRPSFNSDTASRGSHHSHSHSQSQAASGENKKFWHATGIIDRDDPFGDHKHNVRDVREMHRSIEERFEYFRNQPASFFDSNERQNSPPVLSTSRAKEDLKQGADSVDPGFEALNSSLNSTAPLDGDAN